MQKREVLKLGEVKKSAIPLNTDPGPIESVGITWNLVHDF